MRHYFLFCPLFFLFSCDTAKQSAGTPQSPTVKDGYTLVWDEDFKGNTLDLNSWEYQLGDSGWGNNEAQFYTDHPNNTFVKDGFLHIVGRIEKMGSKDYTSARIRTKGKKDFKFGRIDVRAKLPKGQGIWPAIWFMPTDDVYGGWPQSGEIDLMEMVGHEPNVLVGTVHFGPEWPKNKSVGNRYTLPQGDFSNDFHVFTLIWQENKIAWLLNDQFIYHQITPDLLKPEKYPFNERFHLILNLAIGGNWPGYPDATTVFPQEMVVDYVKVYQKK